MNNSSLKIFFLFISILFIVTNISCIENNLILESTPETNDFLYVASFLETQRNYITSPIFPAEVSADEVFSNLENYLIIDIREKTNFDEGHIPNSVNVSPTSLIDFLDSEETSIYSRIIIVSLTGQKSAYVTTLLRLLGNNNIFSLKFGLGYWNSKYSEAWIKSKSTSPNVIFYRRNYPPNKINSMTDFPNSQFEDKDLDVDDKIYSRAQLLLNESVENFEITIEEFESKFDIKYRSYSNCNILFFGDADIFNYVYKFFISIRRYGLYNDGYVLDNSFTLRPDGAMQFDNEKISLNKYLLSIPTAKVIYVYSVNGQESAAITAFLNILGYNAKSIRFGAHSMYSSFFYDRSIVGYKWISENSIKEKIDTIYSATPIVESSFNQDLVSNYPLESGN
jgi:rhodanese-related sulfurtransferase